MIGPTHRLRVIEGSLRCFVLGLLALIPGVGWPAAFVVFHEFKRTRQENGDAWNPARWYLWWGYVLAWVGLSLTLVGAALMGRFLVNHRTTFGFWRNA